MPSARCLSNGATVDASQARGGTDANACGNDGLDEQNNEAMAMGDSQSVATRAVKQVAHDMNPAYSGAVNPVGFMRGGRGSWRSLIVEDVTVWCVTAGTRSASPDR